MRATKFIITILCFLLLITNVNAADCSNADKVALGKEATAVKIGYEEAEEQFNSDEIYPPDGQEDNEDYVAYYNYFKINFFNITEKIFIKFINDETNEVTEIRYKNTNNGHYQINYYDINKTSSFSYVIYASDNTNCNRLELKKGKLSLPAYNPYHEYSKCKLVENFPLCEKYLNTNITYTKFMSEIDKEIAKLNKTDKEDKNEKKDFLENLEKFLNKNKTEVIISLIVIVVLIGGVIIIIVRKRRRRVI